MRIFHRDHVRRTRAVVDQRELAEMLAHAEYAEDDFASVFADQDDLDATLAHHEQRIAGVVLEEDDTSAWVELFAGEIGEALELNLVQSAEQRDGGQEVGCRGRHVEWAKEASKDHRRPKTRGEVTLT